jgi:ribosomal protein L31E
MENKIEYLSLYDFLGKAAGMELGAAVCKVAVELKEKIEERSIENPKYKGKVHLYRREFLDKYFENKN